MHWQSRRRLHPHAAEHALQRQSREAGDWAGKGQEEHDKRATEREKDAKREAANAMKKERR